MSLSIIKRGKNRVKVREDGSVLDILKKDAMRKDLLLHVGPGGFIVEGHRFSQISPYLSHTL